MTEASGRKLGGFLLTKLLGQGAMGAVYKGKQLSLDRDVAIKVILPTYADNPDYIRRFEREAKLIAQLTHQNITQIYEFGTFDGYYLIVMEYVEGTSLKNLLSVQKTLPVDAVCEMMIQIANGLSTGASKNIVHRDIKPENIQINKHGVCKILDFGLAKDDSNNAGMTMAGGIMGTPSFMSPEQCQGKPVDYRADTYGLGTSAYYLLTGQVPYKAESQLAVLNMHCNAPIPDPRVLRPDIPEDLALYVMKLMSKKPEDRCKNAAQIGRDLENILHRMKDRVPLSELAQTWAWDTLIVLPQTDGTSLLDNYVGRDRSTDQTIASGNPWNAQTAQPSAFSQETIVSGFGTGIQTRGETVGATQSFDRTMQPGVTATSMTGVDATLLPNSSVTQTMESTQNKTIMEEAIRTHSRQRLVMVVLLVLVVAVGAFFFRSKEDWSSVEQQLDTIRSKVNNDDYSEIEIAKLLLEKKSSYPKRDLVETEIKGWEKNKQAFVEYNKILLAVADDHYKEAEEQAEQFRVNYSDTKYWNRILAEKSKWKDYAVASKSVEAAVELAKEFKYAEASDRLNKVRSRYVTYKPDKIDELIRAYDLQGSEQRRGALGAEVQRVNTLIGQKEYIQALATVEQILAKGNDKEKADIKRSVDTMISHFKGIIEVQLKNDQLNHEAVEIKFLKQFAQDEKDWFATYDKRVQELVEKYKKLKDQAQEALKNKEYEKALLAYQNARAIQKPAEDELAYLDFLVDVYKAQGDEFFGAGKFAEAYQAYQKGLKVRESDQSLKEKLEAADIKLRESQKSASVEKQIESVLAKGDKAFSSEKYQDALISYKNALSLRPNDQSINEKVRVSSFYVDVEQITKQLNLKEDNTDVIKSNLERLQKSAVKEEEKKLATDLQKKMVVKKSGFLKIRIAKSVSQKSFQEASVYLKEYKAIQNAEDSDLKGSIELFKTEALKNSEELTAKALFIEAGKVLELIQSTLPEVNVKDRLAKIQKEIMEETTRLANVEKLNTLLSEATVEYEKKRYGNALKLIEEAYGLDSKNVDVVALRKKAGFEYYASIGQQAETASRFEEAITHYKKALEYDADRPATRATLEKLERPKAEIILVDTNSKASLQQQAWAASLGLPVEKKVTLSGVEFAFMLIPPGKFMIGTEEGGDPDEKPAKIITISKPFYLLKTEVTNEQYHVFNADEISYSTDPREPVLGIVYSKVLQFSKFLSEQEAIGGKVRVPTEAEWEYACRSGNKGDYNFGNNLPDLKEYGYFKDNAKKINKVMQLKPNSFGLYDMHGNAYEWCRDFYEKKAYSMLGDTDPYFDDGMKGVNKKVKVIRSGDYASTPANLRSANRTGMPHAQREMLQTVGFRVLLEIERQ